MKFKIGFLLLVCFSFSGCMTYYQKNAQVNSLIERGQYKEAYEKNSKIRKAETNKDRLLYWLNQGLLSQLNGDYLSSNNYFERAYLFSQDAQKSAGRELLSMVTNAQNKVYYGEPFEIIMIHYFKAFNFMMLGEKESALVECRRSYNALNKLSDLYNKENKYKRDAFMYNIMGLIFESSGEYNDAFVSYRNAYDIYKNDYQSMFKVGVPQQLKKDLLRTAHLSMMGDMVQHYEKEFGEKYVHESISEDEGEVVVFWNNGLGPVKAEWSVNFTVVGNSSLITFANSTYNLNFSVPWPSSSSSSGLDQLQFIRAAFPKYQERRLFYTNAYVNNQEFEMAQNVNAIAFRALDDRMGKEMTNTLLRLAVKKASELALRSQNTGAGAALGVLNAITEKADTRNWQSLPYHISYARVKVPVGTENLECKMMGVGTEIQKIKVRVTPKSLTFAQVNSLRSNGIVF
ncbi:MAG: hypothetical protein SNJ77_08840 [Cytophagales bacterium]